MTTTPQKSKSLYRGEGSEWAAPIFRRIVELYFFGQTFTLYPWEAEIGLTATPSSTPSQTPLFPEETPTTTP